MTLWKNGKRGFVAAGIICLALVARIVAVSAEGGITYEGSTTIGVNVMPELTKAFTAKTKVAFGPIGGAGSSKGFAAAMEGKADIGGLSRQLKAEEKAKKPYSQIIAYDAVAVFLNDKNPVKALTKDQVKGIFTGAIKNWKEVGGADAPIACVTEILGAGRATVEEFKKDFLGGAEYTKTKEIDKPLDCVKAVAADPNAVTGATMAFKMKGVKMLAIDGVEPSGANVKTGKYCAGRPLILVSKTKPEGDVAKFYEFVLGPDGQKIIGTKFVTVK